MNYTTHQEMTKQMVKPTFRGKQTLHCKTIPLYPDSVDREYLRVTNAYMKVLNDTLKEYLPDLLKVATEEDIVQYRTDGLGDLVGKVVDIFARIGLEVSKRLNVFGLQEKVEKMATSTKMKAAKEWKKEVHATLGIDILEDYYTGDFYKDQLGKWTSTNVDLISTIPQASLGKMKEIVLEGYQNGKPHKQVVKEMQETYNMDKSHARFIARDQVAKLNSDITKHQQKDAGVGKYKWSDSGDSRVREGHSKLNNKIFSWDDPPVVDDKGRRCHPGQDYRCRCVALPVFEIETLDLPIQERKEA